jgi:hypothetical protein
MPAVMPVTGAALGQNLYDGNQARADETQGQQTGRLLIGAMARPNSFEVANDLGNGVPMPQQ